MKKVILFFPLILLISCSENEKKLGKAIEASRDGLALIKDSKADEGREKLLQAKGHYIELLKSEPNNGLYNNNYDWVLMKLGEYEEAKKYLNMALENNSNISPKNAPVKNLEELAVLEAK